jgi:hypothetical protein
MKKERQTYFTTAPKGGTTSGAFSQFVLPQGRTARVLNESVFRKAVDAADKQLASRHSDRKGRTTG